MTCDRCYQPLDVGDHGLNVCPLQPRRAPAVRPDDIPGGIDIEHGICHDDGTPKRYYSQSAITQACVEKGVRRWSDIYEERRVVPAQQLADYHTRAPECIEARRDRLADAQRRRR